jgi:hypothetical protein
VRARFDGSLAKARIRMQIDIAFGDVIVPKPARLEYPTILDFPAPVLLAYPRETVVAEKLEALTALGMLNSRIKDYFDLWLLSRLYSFNGVLLAEAIAATFKNRSTPIERRPIGLTQSFSMDPTKLKQWAAFRGLHRSVTLPEELTDLVSVVAGFCLPVLSSLSDDKGKFLYEWKPAGPWQKATGS